MAATAKAAQSIDGVLWMLMYTETEGAGRVQGIRGHFGGPACFQAAYLFGADHDPVSPTRTAPAGIQPFTAQHPTPCGSDRWFPREEQLAMGITLQHEDHRDGIISVASGDMQRQIRLLDTCLRRAKNLIKGRIVQV